MSNLLFCLMGPTASGKTALACELVEQFPLEIISVDSAMIYRGMNIGTAKPDVETLSKAPHHLIDVLDPTDSYSAALFCEEVARLRQEINHRGHIPLLVGGTMMYFHALQQGLSLLPEADLPTRAFLIQEAEMHGSLYMHQWLARVDPETAARLHPNDTQRVQRALEVYELTSKPLSAFFEREKNRPAYEFVNFILMPEDRQWLHQRIASRFLQMLDEGLIHEVEDLLTKWDLSSNHPSMRMVGYRQVLAYLRGEDSYATLSEKGIAATRQLAKRQLTWLRHWPQSQCFSAENPTTRDEIVAIMKQILDNLHQSLPGEKNV